MPWRSQTRLAVDAYEHDAALDKTIDEATRALIALQRDDGHWCFELEADCTIPAEYVMLGHFLDEVDPALEAKIARYIRARQGEHGGWPLFHGGDFGYLLLCESILRAQIGRR